MNRTEKARPHPDPLPQERVELSQRSLGSWSQYICMRKRGLSRNLSSSSSLEPSEEEDEKEEEDERARSR